MSSESLQERVQKVRRWESQKEMFCALPTWEAEIYCQNCDDFTNHMELGFETQEMLPLLIFCERCETTYMNTEMPIREKVRQVREWEEWAKISGGPGPTDVWLFLLPGAPPTTEEFVRLHRYDCSDVRK